MQRLLKMRRLTKMRKADYDMYDVEHIEPQPKDVEGMREIETSCINQHITLDMLLFINYFNLYKESNAKLQRGISNIQRETGVKV